MVHARPGIVITIDSRVCSQTPVGVAPVLLSRSVNVEHIVVASSSSSFSSSASAVATTARFVLGCRCRVSWGGGGAQTLIGLHCLSYGL